MDFGFFYDLAVYANRNWGGGFDEKSIACMAYDNLLEMEESLKYGIPSATIESLIDCLREDVRNGNDEAETFLDEIKYQLRKAKERTEMENLDLWEV